MAISGDGSTLYVAAFGSDAVAVYDTTELENDTFVPDSDESDSGRRASERPGVGRRE